MDPKPQVNAVQYLAAQAPKEPLPQPFSKNNWQPSSTEKKAFMDKMEIAYNPGAIIQHLNDGSLNTNHVAALTALYPSLKEQVITQVAKAAYDSKTPAISQGMKHNLSLLSDVNVSNPNGINYQQNYQQKPPPQMGSKKGHGSSKPKTDKMPSLMTSTQNLSYKTGKA